MADSALGLSTPHIRSAEAAVYVDGSLAKVSREKALRVCLDCGASFEVPSWKAGAAKYELCHSCRTVNKTCSECGRMWQEARVADDSKCPGCGADYRGNKRSVITRFSRESRRRLMQALAKLHRDVRPIFVTLTYPDTYEHYQDPDQWKKDLRAFEHRIRRKYPKCGFFWRLEVVDRKSGAHIGELFPHFHLLVFGVEYNRLRKFTAQAWYEVVGTNDPDHLAAGTQVARVHSRKGIMSYASKAVGVVMPGEMAKTIQTTVGRVGRWWGISIRENLEAFLSVLEVVSIDDKQAVTLLRYFRRKMGAFGRDYPSLTTFIDGTWLMLKLPNLINPPGERCYQATNREYGFTNEKPKPFWQWAYDEGKLKPA